MRDHRIRGSEGVQGTAAVRPRAARVPGLRFGRDRAPRGRRPAAHPRRRQPPEPEARRRQGVVTGNDGPRPHPVGHARWRHTENAHPLAVEDPAELAIVLNGIVENYRELRERLRAAGHVFSSETDAETVSPPDRAVATTATSSRRHGSPSTSWKGDFAFVAVHRDHPGLLVGARHQCPLVVGVGHGEMFLASNAAAFLRETREVHFPEDGDLVAITRDGAAFVRADDGSRIERALARSTGTTRAPRRPASRRSC